ncbi:FxSxx-COOH system tetratricopeptide repeat protein [Streptomyces sp. NPDC059999]|uniref:FxSxx-COOH system tetratricopeptide repeat protein n=1 Tax=Streptomyces sp. NPDC059999 TaxID=3347030 RepID=UPI0036788586
MPDPAQELTAQLRALEQRARSARRAAGLSVSRRTAAAASTRTKFKVVVRFQAISAWLPAPTSSKRPTVPSPASSEQVLALVWVWSEWAGEKPNERYWRSLLESAQTPAAVRVPASGDQQAKPAAQAADRVSNVRAGMFVGRGGELGALDAAFAEAGEVVVHAVHGLGGVGKSALAAHWAAGRAEAVRWWIAADSTTAVDAGLAALARALHFRSAGQPVEEQVEAATRWLGAHEGWLLVLDNVEDPSHIRPLLDRAGGGRVLITSRRATGWHHHATTIHLDTLTPQDALDLFTRVLTHHGRRDTDGADAVCEELGHLALAVEQAAAYCAETGTHPRAYLDMLARWPATMFAAGPVGSDSERTAARIWLLTLDRLADTPLAGDILRILAWYAPDGIPRDLLDGLGEPPAVTRAIGRLVAYSMITDNYDGTLTVHRLVQAVARTPDVHDRHRQSTDIDDARDAAAVLLAGAFPDNFDQPGNWSRYRALLPHTDALTSRHGPDQDTQHTGIALAHAAAHRLEQGATAAAVPAFERVVSIYERLLGRDHPDTLGARNNLGKAHDAAGSVNRAITLFERALEDCERVLGNHHIHALALRGNLANAHQTLGNLDEAIPLYERALEDCEHALGNDHDYTLTVRGNLANAHQARGNLDRAIPWHERALADNERVLGNDHPHTLGSRNNLANAYRATGDMSRATPLYERTLKDCERVLGDDHPHTLTARNNLADAYEIAGDLSRAIPLHERTLADRERVLGHDHPHTLISRNNCANAYHSAGEVNRAITLYERALDDCERVLGDDHPNTLNSRNNLARAHADAGDLDLAISLHERTLGDCERVLGNDHPFTLRSRNNLASVYTEAGIPERAIPLHERTLADRERILGKDHPDTLNSRIHVAGTYQEAGDFERAIPLLERALADHERILGKDHPHTLHTRATLAHVHESAEDLDRAILLYESTLEACERVLSAEHPLIATVRARLDRARSR